MGEQSALSAPSDAHRRTVHPKQTEATMNNTDGLPNPPEFPLKGPLPPQMQLPDHYPAIQDVIVGPGPNEHALIDQAFQTANQYIHAEWFRISDTVSNNALVAAKASGSDVNVIEDSKNMASAFSKTQLQILTNGGVPFELSSDGFNISHAKTAAISSTALGARTIIGSMNLTNENARDEEFITNDPGINRSVNAVQAMDIINAKNGTTNTPTGLDPALVISPINAEDKLSGLIYSVDPDPSKGWVIATSENWGDPVIQRALLDVAAHGIPVKVLGPEVDENPNQAFNYPFLKALEAGGVQSKWMPAPSPGESATNPVHPYEHLKSIVVMTPKGPVGYLGSINYSFQSAHQIAGLNKAVVGSSVKPNREMGVLFNDPKAISQLTQVMNQDFNNADVLPANPPPSKAPTMKSLEDTDALDAAHAAKRR